MPNLCKECRYFFTDYKYLKSITDTTPKTRDKPSDYIPQYKCKLGHRIEYTKDGWIPCTPGYTCSDFTKK